MKFDRFIRREPVVQFDPPTHEHKRWIFLAELPGHRKYFEDAYVRKVALADYSGDYPDQTDCGVLYLDKTKPITIQSYAARVPLVKPDGERVCTTANWTEVYYLREMHGMQVILPIDPEMLEDTKAYEAVTNLCEWYNVRDLSEDDREKELEQCQECGSTW
jgi:hypothetical protein